VNALISAVLFVDMSRLEPLMIHLTTVCRATETLL